MFRFRASLSPFPRFLAALFLLAGSFACNRASDITKEQAYVNAPQVVLRDRLAPIFEKKGTVHLGDKVYVLEHDRRFSRVRTVHGEEGWMPDRYLIDDETYRKFEALAKDNVKAPAQGHGAAHDTAYLHVAPGRDTDHFYQLKEGDKVELLRRGVAEKPESLQPRPVVQKTSTKDAVQPPPRPAMEDWWLVRTADGKVGWTLARLIDIDVPLEIAQYAEGQSIVSSFVINKVQDGDRQVPQYLLLLTDKQDGQPFDYNQIRVFSWNLKRHRYETAYRERDLNGFFPVQVGSQDFGKDGVEPTFSLHAKNDAGQEYVRQYRMIGPIVKRVLTPEQEQQEAAEKAAKRAEMRAKRSHH